jgi:hypothetical protein
MQEAIAPAEVGLCILTQHIAENDVEPDPSTQARSVRMG